MTTVAAEDYAAARGECRAAKAGDEPEANAGDVRHPWSAERFAAELRPRSEADRDDESGAGEAPAAHVSPYVHFHLPQLAWQAFRETAGETREAPAESVALAGVSAHACRELGDDEPEADSGALADMAEILSPGRPDGLPLSGVSVADASAIASNESASPGSAAAQLRVLTDLLQQMASRVDGSKMEMAVSLNHPFFAATRLKIRKDDDGAIDVRYESDNAAESALLRANAGSMAYALGRRLRCAVSVRHMDDEERQREPG